MALIDIVKTEKLGEVCLFLHTIARQVEARRGEVCLFLYSGDGQVPRKHKGPCIQKVPKGLRYSKVPIGPRYPKCN